MKPIFSLAILAALFGQAVLAKDLCQSFAFSGEVRGTESFRQVIGSEASFFVDPAGDERGWTFEIGPTTLEKVEERRYIYSVTPPWRGRHETMLNTSYGMPAEAAAAKGDTNFWFIFTSKDAKKANEALRQLLFSGATQTTDESLAQLGALPMGKGIFRIVDSDFTPGTLKYPQGIPKELLQHGYPDEATLVSLYGAIKRITFEVELTVPSNYAVPSGLRTHSVDCPEPWTKQWSGLQGKH